MLSLPMLAEGDVGCVWQKTAKRRDLRYELLFYGCSGTYMQLKRGFVYCN